MKPGLQVKTFFDMTVGSQIPVVSLPPSICGCKFFALDDLGDHVSTCTTHSGAKKAHDWAVEQLADLFRTTHKVKTQQAAKSRGQRCAADLADAAGSVPANRETGLEMPIPASRETGLEMVFLYRPGMVGNHCEAKFV